MKKFLCLFALITMMSLTFTGCNKGKNIDTDIDTNTIEDVDDAKLDFEITQKVVFVYQYTNWAEIYTNEGFYIDNHGNKVAFDVSDEDEKYYKIDELVPYLESRDDLVAEPFLDEKELKKYYLWFSKISPDAELNRYGSGSADWGSFKWYGIKPSSENGEIAILLSENGDWITENKDSYATKLAEELEQKKRKNNNKKKVGMDTSEPETVDCSIDKNNDGEDNVVPIFEDYEYDEGIDDFEIPQKIAFVYHYSNLAWGVQNNGFYIDCNGNVVNFDLSDQEQNSSVPEKFLPYLESIEDEESRKCMEEKDVKQLYYWLTQISPDYEFSEKQSKGCDMGTSRFYGILYDENGNATSILLEQTGDWSYYNMDSYAMKIMKKVGQTRGAE